MDSTTTAAAAAPTITTIPPTNSQGSAGSGSNAGNNNNPWDSVEEERRRVTVTTAMTRVVHRNEILLLVVVVPMVRPWDNASNPTCQSRHWVAAAHPFYKPNNHNPAQNHNHNKTRPTSRVCVAWKIPAMRPWSTEARVTSCAVYNVRGFYKPKDNPVRCVDSTSTWSLSITLGKQKLNDLFVHVCIYG